MIPGDVPTEDREIPSNWDVLHNPESETEPPDEAEVHSHDRTDSPPTINLLASSWADAVSSLAVCTGALLFLNATGHHGSLAALPWAAILGFSWWVAAASILITIRQGTPGMLLAGVHFARPVAPRRVALVVAAAAVSASLLGLPGLLGPRRSPVAVTGGSVLEALPTD
jgi:hypothetical protein